MSINPLLNPYILEGRIVTMGPQGVIPEGAIFIEKNVIKAVQNDKDPTPSGFEGTTRVRTGDTIYPGLIELHNHRSLIRMNNFYEWFRYQFLFRKPYNFTRFWVYIFK